MVVLGSFAYPNGMAGTKRIQHFIDALANKKAAIRVLMTAFPDWPGQQPKGTHQGVRYQSIGKSRTGQLVGLLLTPWRALVGCWLLLQWRKSSGNCIYLYDGITLENLPMVIIARWAGYKVVVDIMEDYNFALENMRWARRIKMRSQIWLERRLHRLVDGLVVISNYLQTKFNWVKPTGLPMVLIPIAAKVEDTPIPETNNEVVKFVYSGTFGKKDNVDLLVKAFSALAQKHEGCELLLSGKGAHVEEILTHSTTDRVKYVGYLSREEFEQFLNDGDVMCMTRNQSTFANAGFPFKLGEYLATGKPVIASNVGDIGHYLTNEENALLVEPEDEKGLEAAMEFALLHPEKNKNDWGTG